MTLAQGVVIGGPAITQNCQLVLEEGWWVAEMAWHAQGDWSLHVK